MLTLRRHNQYREIRTPPLLYLAGYENLVAEASARLVCRTNELGKQD